MMMKAIKERLKIFLYSILADADVALVVGRRLS
jgi:hypothetical protein